MRGLDARNGSLFSYVDLEARVPEKHSLRVIRRISDDVLAKMSGLFASAYSPIGRPSIAPEKLLRALLLQAFYTIRSERQLVERIDFDLLFRWFVGLGIDDRVWDASTFCKNRGRFLEMDAAAELLQGVIGHPDVRRRMSSDHFSVDGTLIDPPRWPADHHTSGDGSIASCDRWASMKSFRPKSEDCDDDPGTGRNAKRDFHGEKRSNGSHESTTDPDARLYRKGSGQASRLCLIGTALMENRNGLAINGRLTTATGVSECLAAIDLAEEHIPQGGTLGGDKAFDTADLVAELRERGITPHVAQNAYDTGRAWRRSNIDRRTTRRPRYDASQRCRKRIEEIFARHGLLTMAPSGMDRCAAARDG